MIDLYEPKKIQQHQLERLRTWAAMGQYCREQLTKLDDEAQQEARKSFEFCLYHGADRSELIRKFAREAPPGVEYQYEGTKTAGIMAAKLYDLLNSALGKVSQDHYRSIGQDLFQAVEAMLNNFELVPRMSLPLTDVPARPINSKMDHWLIQQPLPNSEAEHAGINQSYLEATTRRPFMTFRMGTKRRLENVESYWFEGGSTRALFNNIPSDDPRWEEARLQLTLYAPYVLLCNGVLRGHEWCEAITQTINANATPDLLKPVLIILADAVDEQTVFPDDTFYTIVLPAPRDAEIRQGSFIPDRPQLEAMAQAFGAQVATLWVAPPSSANLADPREPDWPGLARQLVRVRVVQIDRWRAIVVLPRGCTVRDAAVSLSLFALY